nr:reverse transcriptase domain-containing protein [Tanacetum cinerariifolium]
MVHPHLHYHHNPRKVPSWRSHLFRAKGRAEMEDPPEDPPEVSMADNRTMVELLQAPTEGYKDAIVIPEIAANNFKLKHGLINLVQNKQLFGHDKEDPHAHIRYFNKITFTMRVPNGMSHHGFSELHQLDTFYNALNVNDQDSLNSAAGAIAKVSMSSSTPSISSDVVELKDMVRALLLDKKNQSSAPAHSHTPAPVKAVEPNYVTCGGAHSYQNCHATNGNVYRDNVQDFTDALILMPKSASTLKALIQNKEKISEMARTPMNEHCSAVILNKLPRKLGDPGKFLIPCEFTGMDECLALADLGASINLLPFSVWEGLSLLELTSTYMTLKLADHSVSKPIGIAKDVSVKVGVFHFPADFVVVDFEPDPRVPLILGRCFLKTGQALIDMHKGELTLRIRNEVITYNLDQTSRYSANYNQMTRNKIDVIDMACEEYSQEVLGFSDITVSGNPTPYDDPIVSTTSPTLTPFGDSDFLLFEEADAFLGLKNDPNSLEFNPFYYDPKGNILLLEAILNSKPLPPLPNHEQYMPSFKKEFKVCEAKTVKSSVDKPPEVELKDLPPTLNTHFWRATTSCPPWVSPVHCVPKKGGFIVVENEENELIPTRLVTGWRGMNTIVSSMVSPGIFKLPLTLVIRRKPHSPPHTKRLPIVACLSVCAMHRACFKGTKCFKGVKTPIYVLTGRRAILWSKRALSSAIRFLRTGLRLKAKVDVIAKLPHPTAVKGAVLGQRHEKHFRPIHYASKMMTDAKSNYTTTEKEMLAVVYAFKKLWSYLIMNKSIVHTDHSALKYLFSKKDAKARLLCAPWFADFANYHAGNFIVKGWSISITFRFSVGLQTPDDLSQSWLGFIEKIGVHG